MKRRHALVGAGLAIIALVCGAMLGVDRWGRTIPAYAQPQHYDTGRIVVTLPHTVSHRFRFRNDRDEPVELVKIDPSCGCTKVEAPIRRLEPGQSGWIEMSVALTGSGGSNTSVALSWSTGETVRYHFDAFAQVSRELSLSRITVDLEVDESRSILLTYIDQEGREPGPVVFDPLEGIEIEVAPWEQVIAPDRRLGVAARYSAAARLRLTRSMEEVGRVNFSLPNYPDVPRAQLVVRTPELIERVGRDVIKRLREGAGPIQPRSPDESATGARAVVPGSAESAATDPGATDRQ